MNKPFDYIAGNTKLLKSQPLITTCNRQTIFCSALSGISFCSGHLLLKSKSMLDFRAIIMVKNMLLHSNPSLKPSAMMLANSQGTVRSTYGGKNGKRKGISLQLADLRHSPPSWNGVAEAQKGWRTGIYALWGSRHTKTWWNMSAGDRVISPGNAKSDKLLQTHRI